MHWVLQAYVKFTKWKYMTSYVDIGRVIIYGRQARPDIMLVGVPGHDVLLSPFLLPDKRLWNSYLCNNSNDFNNSRCI